MRARHAMLLLLVVLATSLLLAGCGNDKEGAVVARVGSTEITELEFRRRLEELPPFARQQFSGPEGMLEFLDRLVEEEVVYQAAKDAGYADDPEVRRAVRAVERRTMIQKYYSDVVEGGVEVPEEEIVAYHEEHDELFQRPARIQFRHIMTSTRPAAEAARQRALAGEGFAEVARDVSIDTATRDAGGLMSPVSRGSGVPTLGIDADLVESLFEWKVGEVTDVIRSGKGWHIFRIEEKNEAGKKPLEDVREQIVNSLKPQEARERYEQLLEEYRERYRATINEGHFRKQPRSEEELFTLAQETEDPLNRLNYYSELVFNYPESEHAAEAQFMIGFIQAEELQNYPAARNAFQRMLERYPDSELAESARWMLDNMESESPPFGEADVLETEQGAGS
ncbi:MAG: tetratricopeptide repeat protein [Candidatus Eisenbacteria bacterium]|nr:tetratricopeptide repeat protein [Candidatus Eisenbacteria bacterium]